MKKEFALIIPLILMSAFAVPALAAESPQYGPKTITIVDYMGVEDVTEHKWDVIYNSNYYATRIYSKGQRLLGWEIEKNKHSIVSERDFVSDTETNPPLCGYKTVTYFDYEGYDVKEHNWKCLYDNDFYVIKIYTENGNNMLLGWQIFRNGQLVSTRAFI
ncbi:MAG: hypothetical protein GTN36_00215 [Candidatus Aenigmarchaeota archaeon]|nr:hypothetical protein [Candidatus Aenigmarchaeota archaeon]